MIEVIKNDSINLGMKHYQTNHFHHLHQNNNIFRQQLQEQEEYILTNNINNNINNNHNNNNNNNKKKKINKNNNNKNNLYQKNCCEEEGERNRLEKEHFGEEPNRSSTIVGGGRIMSHLLPAFVVDPIHQLHDLDTPHMIVYRKMENLIQRMWTGGENESSSSNVNSNMHNNMGNTGNISSSTNDNDGVPIKTVKGFLSKIPSVVTGADIIQWLMRKLRCDCEEAVRLASQLAVQGYVFSIDDHSCTVKNDGTFYRFQTPYYWPSWGVEPDITEYAVYLCKRTMAGAKASRTPLADWEAEALSRLQKQLSRKWEFIYMQAEAQVKVERKRDNIERKIIASQERAYWYLHKPPPGTVNTRDVDVRKTMKTQQLVIARLSDLTESKWLLLSEMEQVRIIEYLNKEIVCWTDRGEKRSMKNSKVAESYISYYEQHREYDFLLPGSIDAHNPWIDASSADDCWADERGALLQSNMQNSGVTSIPTTTTTVTSTQHVNISARRARKWAFSINEMLKDPRGHDAFMKFLESEYSSENLRFYAACKHLRLVAQSAIVATIRHIYHEFLAPGALYPINIDSRIMALTRQRLENSNLLMSRSPKNSRNISSSINTAINEKANLTTTSTTSIMTTTAVTMATTTILTQFTSTTSTNGSVSMVAQRTLSQAPSLNNQLNMKEGTTNNQLTSLMSTKENSNSINNSKDGDSNSMLSSNQSLNVSNLRYIFDEAQEHIFSLMSRDSYNRFIKSDKYRDLISVTTPSTLIGTTIIGTGLTTNTTSSSTALMSAMTSNIFSANPTSSSPAAVAPTTSTIHASTTTTTTGGATTTLTPSNNFYAHIRQNSLALVPVTSSTNSMINVSSTIPTTTTTLNSITLSTITAAVQKNSIKSTSPSLPLTQTSSVTTTLPITSPVTSIVTAMVAVTNIPTTNTHTASTESRDSYNLREKHQSLKADSKTSSISPSFATSSYVIPSATTAPITTASVNRKKKKKVQSTISHDHPPPPQSSSTTSSFPSNNQNQNSSICDNTIHANSQGQFPSNVLTSDSVHKSDSCKNFHIDNREKSNSIMEKNKRTKHRISKTSSSKQNDRRHRTSTKAGSSSASTNSKKNNSPNVQEIVTSTSGTVVKIARDSSHKQESRKYV
ncbi:hypothetical protein SNEBB_004130 [Seison nebaliae]|nr:hypothetical protein SNEBB_004130 [Seison nebaliae]